MLCFVIELVRMIGTFTYSRARWLVPAATASSELGGGMLARNSRFKTRFGIT